MTSLLPEYASPPRLLVSVRDLHEARIARAAGCDVIDLKEPRRGSLGMVDMPVARQIAAEMPESQLSLALGELTDWRYSAEIPSIPVQFKYLKLGLSHQASNHRWREDWQEFRRSVDERSACRFQSIAVIYADREAARSPVPESIIQAAAETGCAGVLFDTWCKAGGSLTDHFASECLKSHIEAIHAAGMLAALAGSIRTDQLAALLPLGADVVAVRGAVCRDADRTAGVSADSIVSFKQCLNRPAAIPDAVSRHSETGR